MSEPQTLPAPAPTTAPAPAPTKAQLALMNRDVVSSVSQRIFALMEQGELHLPANYSAENALKAAWLAIQAAENKDHVPALVCCTPNSIANALLEMVVLGLTPAKDQCYFIVYGKTLLCQKSYFGTIALLKRVFGEQADVFPQVVYEGDDFAYEIVGGNKRITKHVQQLSNVDDSKIVGAYAIIVPGDGHAEHTEIMTLAQIKKAWDQGQTHGGSPAHKNFGGEMCKKSVLNRGTKILINSSNDKYLVKVLRRQEMVAAAAEMDEKVLESGTEELELEAAPQAALPAAPSRVEDLEAAKRGDLEAAKRLSVPPPPPPPILFADQPSESEEDILRRDAERFEREQAEAAKPVRGSKGQPKRDW